MEKWLRGRKQSKEEMGISLSRGKVPAEISGICRSVLFKMPIKNVEKGKSSERQRSHMTKS